MLTAIVLRDNLIPLLKKGKCVAKNTSSISSDVLELLQGNGYERVDEQRTFIVTESKEKCELNESILKLIVCMTRRRLNNFAAGIVVRAAAALRCAVGRGQGRRARPRAI